MTSVLLSRRDIEFLLYEWLDVEELTVRSRFADHSRATFDAALELSRLIAERDFASHNRESDENEPYVDGDTVRLIPEVSAALQRFIDAGLMAGTMDYELDGAQLPHVVASACHAWFQAANISTFNYPFLTIANAHLLVDHGSVEQIESFVRPMAQGRFFGTMCLSEPEAGSSLGDISTKAESLADGSFRIFGTKMWISGGEHSLSDNIVHLVLARSPNGAAGVKGLSLFIVPKILLKGDGSLGERNDVVLAGLNHKMGNRGTTNTLLAFGEGAFRPGGAAGAVGYLVGQPDHGLSYMFHMMNEARIGVGLGATALGYTGFLKSLSYAATRPQGRPAGDKDVSAPPVPIIQHPDVKRMLLAQKSYVEGALALNLFCGRLVDEQRTAEDPDQAEEARLLLDILTPIAKSWPAQWCLEANSLAIQVHGGYGYARDHDLEQHYRDNRLNQIHEGTHGIQALDLLGRKVHLQEGVRLELLLARIRATAARAETVGGEPAVLATELSAAADELATVTDRLWEKGDAALALANAAVYLEAAGHVVLSWIWLDQFLATHGKEGDFYDGKRQAARYFFAFELPKTWPQFALLSRLDATVAEMDPAWF